MVVILPYQDDHHNGTELMFSIRSLVKHFKAMTGLLVVGDKPKWLKSEYYLPVSDIPIRRDYSMYNKAMMGARELKVDEFLYTCDDHFCLTDFDETLPNYYYGTCKNASLNHASTRYRNLYKNCPDGWLNYDIHCQIIMRPFDWGSTSIETDRPVKSNYANQAGVEGTPVIDCKFANPHTYDQIKGIIKGRPFFSTSPFCVNKPMMDVLNELYPQKSVYEL